MPYTPSQKLGFCVLLFSETVILTFRWILVKLHIRKANPLDERKREALLKMIQEVRQ